MRGGSITKLYPIAKHSIDFLLSLIAIVFLLPLFLLIAIAIKIDSKGSVIFKQKRIGENKKEFYILKFRSMGTDAPPNMPTHLLNSHEMLITKVGHFLRKTSLDELPQLINILRGEMSIVGPRPALWNQYDLIAERDKYRVNNIRPGLTGWAQINGRDELPVNIKAKYDGEYAEKMSFSFDIKVFVKTIFKVIMSDGIREGVGYTKSRE